MSKLLTNNVVKLNVPFASRGNGGVIEMGTTGVVNHLGKPGPNGTTTYGVWFNVNGKRVQRMVMECCLTKVADWGHMGPRGEIRTGPKK